MADYTISATSKLEYSATENGTYNQIKGLKSIPNIGDEPSKIDTTTLDNEKFETEVNGLMPAVSLAFPFLMEDPKAGANITLVHSLADNTVYFWKITRSNGIIHTFKSEVKYSFNEVGVNEIANFTMYLAPVEEIVTTVPSTSY